MEIQYIVLDQKIIKKVLIIITLFIKLVMSQEVEWMAIIKQQHVNQDYQNHGILIYQVHVWNHFLIKVYSQIKSQMDKHLLHINQLYNLFNYLY